MRKNINVETALSILENSDRNLTIDQIVNNGINLELINPDKIPSFIAAIKKESKNPIGRIKASDSYPIKYTKRIPKKSTHNHNIVEIINDDIVEIKNIENRNELIKRITSYLIFKLRHQRQNHFEIYKELEDNGFPLSILNCGRAEFYKILNNIGIFNMEIDGGNKMFTLVKVNDSITKYWHYTSMNGFWKNTYKLKDDNGNYTDIAIINSYLLDCLFNNKIVNVEVLDKELKREDDIYDTLNNKKVKRLINYFKSKYPSIFDNEDDIVNNISKDIDLDLFNEKFIEYKEKLNNIQNQTIDIKLWENIEEYTEVLDNKINRILDYGNRKQKEKIIKDITFILNKPESLEIIKNILDKPESLEIIEKLLSDDSNNRDTTGEEYSHPIEEAIRNILINSSSDYKSPIGKREFGDIYLLWELLTIAINVKLSIKKTDKGKVKQGAPNLTTINRIILNLSNVGIYILIFIRYDLDTNTFDVIVEDFYDIIHYVKYNAGPQQTMLNTKYFVDYDINDVKYEYNYDVIAEQLSKLKIESQKTTAQKRKDKLPTHQKIEFNIESLSGSLDTVIDDGTEIPYKLINKMIGTVLGDNDYINNLNKINSDKLINKLIKTYKEFKTEEI